MRRAAIIGVALFLSSARARAGDPAAAQVLFTEARALMAQGKYEAACPKLEESQKQDPGIGTLFNLSDCYEHVGKITSAWAGFVEVAGLARAAGQKAREADARARADALATKLPLLTIKIKAPMPGLVVLRDGVDIGRALWDEAAPVDAGTHVVKVSAPGKATRVLEVVVPPGAGNTDLVVDPLDEAPPPAREAPPPLPVTTPGPHAPALQSGSPATNASSGSAQRVAGVAVGVIGVVGVGIGAFFGMRAIEKKDEAGPRCRGDVCDAEGVRLRDDSYDAGNVATYAFAIGLAAVGAGAILFLTAPRDSGVRAAATLGGVRVEARW